MKRFLSPKSSALGDSAPPAPTPMPALLTCPVLTAPSGPLSAQVSTGLPPQRAQHLVCCWPGPAASRGWGRVGED